MSQVDEKKENSSSGEKAEKKQRKSGERSDFLAGYAMSKTNFKSTDNLRTTGVHVMGQKGIYILYLYLKVF